MNDMPKGDRGTARQLVPVADTVPALRDPYGRLSLYGAGDETATQPGFNILEYLRTLYKRKWLILSVAMAFVVISAVKTLMETPLYTATVRVQIDREARIIEGGNVAPQYSDYEFMQTQYQLIEGRTMAERVVSALKLGNDADFLNPQGGMSITEAVMGLLGLIPSAGGGKTDEIAAERWASGIVLGHRAVSPVPDSRLVDIRYTDPDPKRAQRIANAYGDAFIASSIDKRFQANESAKIFIDDKIK